MMAGKSRIDEGCEELNVVADPWTHGAFGDVVD